MSERVGARRLASVGVAASAMLAFAAVLPFAFEPVDAGMILYPSWLTARGWLPYRDYVHMYGPSLFAVNGALFRVFGPDLLAVRLLLVVLKTVVALQVFWIARRVAPTAIALGCAAVLLAAWSVPLWTSVTPYAVYYEMPLALAALTLVLRVPPRWLGAGLACGIAATFKHTAGLFVLAALLLDAFARVRGGAETRVAGGVRALALLGVVGLIVVYLGHAVVGFGGLVLGLPLALAATRLLVRDRAGGGGLRDAFALGGGFLLPLVATAVVFLVAGGGGRAVFDTLAGLPQQVTWFVPATPPTPRAGLVAAAWGLALVGTGARRSTGFRVACVTGALVAVAAFDHSVRLIGGWDAYAGGRAWSGGRGWYGDAYGLVAWAPAAIVWVGMWPAWRAGGAARCVFLFAAANLLQLHPAADLPHVLLVLPAMLPLAAFLAAHALPQAGWRRVARGVLLAFAGLVVATPFADTLRLRLAAPRSPAPFERATGVRAETPSAAALGRLVTQLRAEVPIDRPILVLSGESLIYVLAERDSVFAANEFLLYLISLGLLPDEAARRLLDEPAMVARLRQAGPVIVDEPGTPASMRIRRALPEVAATIDAGWDTRTTVGPYQLLVPRG